MPLLPHLHGENPFAKCSVANIAILSGKRVKPENPYRKFSRNLPMERIRNPEKPSLILLECS